MHLSNQGILYLTQDDIIPHIMSLRTYERLSGAKSISTIKPHPGQPALVNYESLPPKYKHKLQQHLGYCPLEHAKAKQTAQNLHAAFSRISPHTTAYGYYLSKGIAQATALQYATAISILELLKSSVKKCRAMGFSGKSALLDYAANWLSQNPIKGLQTGSAEYLRKKVSEYKKTKYECVISRKHGNSNRQIIDILQLQTIISIAGTANQYSLGQIYDEYLYHCHQQQWKPVSEERIRQIIVENRQQIDYARFGESYHYDVYGRTRTRRKPMPDQLWSIDGTPVNLFQMREDGEIIATTVYLFAVADAGSAKILGWSYGYTEDSELVYRAIKMACHVAGALPYQFQYDNGKAVISKAITEVRDKLAKYNTANRPYKAKPKYIEQIFALVQDQALRANDHFRGGNTDTRSPRFMPNQDFVALMKKNATPPAVREENMYYMDEAIAFWNNRKEKKTGLTPNQKYAQQDPNRRVYDTLAFVTDFYLRKDDKMYLQDGIQLQITTKLQTSKTEKLQKQTHHLRYTVEHIDDWDATMMRKHFTIYYDPDNLDTIYLFQKEKFVTHATLWNPLPGAIADYQEGEGARVQEHIQKQKQQEATIKAAVISTENYLQNAGLVKAGFKNVHKDAYNQAEAELDHYRKLGYCNHPAPKQKESTRAGLYDSSETGKALT